MNAFIDSGNVLSGERLTDKMLYRFDNIEKSYGPHDVLQGATWQHIRNLDEDPAHTYAYTSMEFLKDRALFTYYAGPAAGVRSEPRWSLKLKAVPLNWFYQ